MSAYISALYQELIARRRRLRAAFSDRGQALIEFLVLVGLAAGSLGLLSRPWMPETAPWGFALPFVFFAGFLLIEARRQQTVRRGADADAIGPSYDWAFLLWGLACGVAGAAAFVIAWQADPPPGPAPEWAPPEDVIDFDLAPGDAPPPPPE